MRKYYRAGQKPATAPIPEQEKSEEKAKNLTPHQQHEILRLARKKANVILQKQLGAEYQVDLGEFLNLGNVPVNEVFGPDGKVIWPSKPYPKIVADRAFEYFSQGKTPNQIAEILGLTVQQIAYWRDNLDWKERLSRVAAVAQEQFVQKLGDDISEKRAAIDDKHKRAAAWIGSVMGKEMDETLKEKKRSELEARFLRVKTLKMGAEVIQNTITLERKIWQLDEKDGGEADVIPNEFVWEIRTPEGQLLDSSKGDDLADYLPNQNPHQYIPGADQANYKHTVINLNATARPQDPSSGIRKVNIHELERQAQEERSGVSNG